MASFDQVQSIHTSITTDTTSGSKAVLQLKIDGANEVSNFPSYPKENRLKISC